MTAAPQFTSSQVRFSACEAKYYIKYRTQKTIYQIQNYIGQHAKKDRTLTESGS